MSTIPRFRSNLHRRHFERQVLKRQKQLEQERRTCAHREKVERKRQTRVKSFGQLGADATRSIGAIVVFVVSVLYFVYLPLLSRDRPYVNYDDPHNFKHNSHVHELSWDNIQWAFSAEGSRIGVFEPVANVVKMLTFSICSRIDAADEDHPAPSMCIHRLSVGVHSLNVIASAMLSVRTYRAIASARTRSAENDTSVHLVVISFVAALLVGTHPQRVEVVAWASAVPYLLACSFVIVSLLAHLQHRASHTTTSACSRLTPFALSPWRVVSVLTYACATMSKAASIGTVAVHLCFDAYDFTVRTSRERPGQSVGIVQTIRVVVALLIDNVVLVLVAAISIWIASLNSGIPADLTETKAAVNLPWLERVLIASHLIIFYVLRDIVPTSMWPHRMCARYPLPRTAGTVSFWNDASTSPSVPFGASFVVVVATTLCAGGYVFRRITRRDISATGAIVLLSVSIFWFMYVASLAPTLGVLSAYHVSTYGADRYAYIASMTCLTPALAACACYVTSRRRKLLVALVALAVSLGVSNGTSTRNTLEHWKNSVSLWTESIENCPNDIAAYSQLGVQLLGHPNRRADAIASLKKAIELEPHFISALLNLGVALEQDGLLKEASEAHLRATEANPANHIAWYNAGVVLTKMAEQDGYPTDLVKQASNALARAVAISPSDVSATSSLGLVLCDYDVTHRRPITVTIPRANFKDASGLDILQRLATSPSALIAHIHNAAHCLRGLGRLDESLRETQRALRLDPSFAPSRSLFDVLQHEIQATSIPRP